MMAHAPDYLLLDDLFSLVGSENFASEWTGGESKLVMALPSDYWRPPETMAELMASFQSADWLSEDYINRYADEKAIDRYKNVAHLIVHKCRIGEYLAFLVHADGQLTGVDNSKITSEPFQQMIYYPGTPNRDRLRFVPNAQSGEWAGRLRDNLKQPNESPELTRRRARSQKKREMYNNWYQLVRKYYTQHGGRLTREGIAKKIAADPDANDPITKKPPSWRSVVRRLNEFFPGWAEKNRADNPADNSARP